MPDQATLGTHAVGPPKVKALRVASTLVWSQAQREPNKKLRRALLALAERLDAEADLTLKCPKCVVP